MADKSREADSAPKHRACDECRFRKIACSKEPGGCARCEKEGLQCHYSPQKPMGRPRKRRLVDPEDHQQAEAVNVNVTNHAAAMTTTAMTTETSSARRESSINGFDLDYDHLAAMPLDDQIDVAAICETVGPDSSKQLCGLYEWNAPSGAISFIDLLPDFSPESPDVFGQGDPSSMAFMQGLSSGSSILGHSPMDGLPSLCSSPMNNTSTCPRSASFNNCANNCNSCGNHDHISNDHQGEATCTPPAQPRCTSYQNAFVSTPPYHDNSQSQDHDYQERGLERHSHSANTPPRTACSSPNHGAVPSCAPRCEGSRDASRGCQNHCQDRHYTTPAPLFAAPHVQPTPHSTPQSRPQCQSHFHVESPSPSESLSQSQSQSYSRASGIPCTCLSSIYFALNSLAQLPAHIPSAIRTARHASKMAYQVINCPECYDVTIVDPSKQPPIQCFQNLMCLGSLVPAACNAYVTILRMVDVETERAKAEKRRLWFSLGELGGSWTAVLLSCHGEFLRKCNDKYIPPDVWRTAIRRILRLDVHGAEGGGGPAASSMPTPQFSAPTPCSQADEEPAGEAEPHQPLKGVITLLDEKNRRRHAQIDHLITTGRMPENSPYLLFPGGHRVVPPEARNCSHMLETARLALSNLSIA